VAWEVVGVAIQLGVLAVVAVVFVVRLGLALSGRLPKPPAE
jgi:hypothetical protein